MKTPKALEFNGKLYSYDSDNLLVHVRMFLGLKSVESVLITKIYDDVEFYDPAFLEMDDIESHDIIDTIWGWGIGDTFVPIENAQDFWEDTVWSFITTEELPNVLIEKYIDCPYCEGTGEIEYTDGSVALCDHKGGEREPEDDRELEN